jgi:hypothetical protein
MTHDSRQAEDDLAFMRALVADRGSDTHSFGIIYMSAGVLYGLQCLLNGALLGGAIPTSTPAWILIGVLPTVVFLGVVFYERWRTRGTDAGAGTTSRALKAAFVGGAIANMVVALIIGWVAYERRDWSIWFLFPVVVCAFQGAIWFTVATLRRRAWQGATAICWLASAVALGLLIDYTAAYLVTLGIAFFACMALPGYIMVRSPAQTQATA